MNILRALLTLAVAVPLAADPITDIKAALSKLTARDAIRATYEVQRSVVSEGKFDNDKVSGKAVVEIEGSGGEFRIVMPKPLVDQIGRELEARALDVEKQTPTVDAVSQVNPVDAATAIDFAPTLLRMLHGAKLVSDTQSTFQGKPVRAVVVRVQDRIEKEDAGRVKVSENRLTLWIGPDLIPVGAEHLFGAKYSVFVLKLEMKHKKSWYLTQVGDRLVRVRHESTENSSGMGQKANEALVSTVRVH